MLVIIFSKSEITYINKKPIVFVICLAYTIIKTIMFKKKVDLSVFHLTILNLPFSS